MNYLLPEIPRIHTALAEWVAVMVLIIIFQKRFSKRRIIILAVMALAVQCGFHLLAGRLPLYFWIPTMMMAVVLMFLWIYSFCQMSISDALYLGVRAFVLAEFAASLEWQMYCFYIYPRKMELDWLWRLIIIIVVYLLLFVSAYYLERRFVQADRKVHIRGRELLSAAIIGVAAFVVSNIGFTGSYTVFSLRYDVEIFIVRTTVNFGGLAVLYAQYILNSELRAKAELDAIQNVLKRQFDQYQLYRENIELLNMKYHDLKNQIAVIRAEQDPVKKESYLTEMEQRIKLYETQHVTGNQVLDTVLTSKNLICMEKNIELTCVVNGRLLDFMEAMDICTIFGNALDNAIECEVKISDPKKRLINVAVFAKNNLLMIRFENYFQGKLKNVVEGIPATTKRNKDFHGYGLKSIRYSAKRYGGSVTINQKNDWFELKILIPLK